VSRIVMQSEPNHPLNLRTARLTLVSFTYELVTAALNDRNVFAQHLGARVPGEWPGPDYAEVLPMLAQSLAQWPDHARWGKLIIHTADRVLIGDVGCHGHRIKTAWLRSATASCPRTAATAMRRKRRRA
jgi:hypothetical protein